MKLNRKLVLVLALLVSVIMATTGTLAYLTDRDMETNTFTLGKVDITVNEDFEEGQRLLPDVTITKKARITNNLQNSSDAYVWMAISVPKALAPYLELELADGYTKTELEGQQVPSEDEGKFVSYIVKYPKILKPGEFTPDLLRSVTLNKFVNYHDNAYYIVKNGEETKLDLGEQSEIVIYVDGFAIQAKGFEDKSVEDAYNAYMSQWKALSNGGSSTGDNESGSGDNSGDDNDENWNPPIGAQVVSSTEELLQAMADGKTDILLKNGTYTWNSNDTNIANATAGRGKTLKLYGESKTGVIIQNIYEAGGDAGADYDFQGSDVTFYSMTISVENNTASNYKSYAYMTATYNNCIIEGEYTLSNYKHVFNDCTLNVSGNAYNIWTWGATEATFDNCTFNSDGKAMLLYGTVDTKLVLKNCVFNDNGGLTDKKAAVEIGNDYNKSYELIVNNTIVNGYEINDKGINTGTTLWANKNSMGKDKLNVIVDGVDVY